jgi:hypothetical protein
MRESISDRSSLKGLVMMARATSERKSLSAGLKLRGRCMPKM